MPSVDRAGDGPAATAAAAVTAAAAAAVDDAAAAPADPRAVSSTMNCGMRTTIAVMSSWKPRRVDATCA
jgi:hypothetical protein